MAALPAFSTFSTNVSLVDEADLDKALSSFDMPVHDEDDQPLDVIGLS